MTGHIFNGQEEPVGSTVAWRAAWCGGDIVVAPRKDVPAILISPVLGMPADAKSWVISASTE